MKKATTTTPTPELSTPLGTDPQAASELSGKNLRGEVAGCPTGLTNLDQDTTKRKDADAAPGASSNDICGSSRGSC